MSVSSVAANLSGVFTGVGGVSGAGGGAATNSGAAAALSATNGGSTATTTAATATPTTRRMLFNLSSMSRQQQQQTLTHLLEQLVTLNHELQRNEGAAGVLDFASKYLQGLDAQTRVKERWYQWQNRFCKLSFQQG